MRRLHVLISGLLAVLLCLLSINPTTASADGDYLVKGAILRTYTAAGGAYVVGSPFELEHKVTISGVNGYSQRFDNSIAGVSTVVWNRLGGGWAVTPKSTSPKLAKIANERDALAASGLRQGVVFRSGEVHPASTADKLNLSGLLRGGVLIDLRTTGTKDPNLPDTLYVTNLVADGVVNTMPEKTMDAFGDHGELGEPINGKAAQGRAVLDEVAAAGVDLAEVFDALEAEGVEKFIVSWHELIASVEKAIASVK